MDDSDVPRHALSDEEMGRLAKAVCRELATGDPPPRLVEALAALLRQHGLAELPVSRPGSGSPIPIGPYEIPIELLQAGWDRATSEDDDPGAMSGPPGTSGQTEDAMARLAAAAAGPRPSRGPRTSGQEKP
ncbi:MAG: hypothetical protein HPY69_02905 [Armatimonadetes bacterium]|nr:hypothetical protein [Armatimonadota bacterium]